MKKLFVIAIIIIVALAMAAAAYADSSGPPSKPAEYCNSNSCGYANNDDCPNLKSCPVRRANGTLQSDAKIELNITAYGNLEGGGCGRGVCRVPDNTK